MSDAPERTDEAVNPAGAKRTEARVPELDGVRALAIGSVLIWHYLVTQIEMRPGSWVAKAMPLLGFTWSGVDLFFVLSGYLIGGILLDHRASKSLFRTFYVRRACRILPPYLLVVAAYYAAVAFGLHPSDWLFERPLPAWAYLTMTQNFAMASAGSFGPNWLGTTWSLAIEEQFYLFLPFVVAFAKRGQALAIVALLALAAPFFRLSEGGLGAYVLPYCRADSLLLGVLAAALVRHELWTRERTTLRVALPVLTVLGLGGALALSLGGAFIGDVALHAVLAVAYTALLLSVVAGVGAAWTAPLRSRPMLWIGRRSYMIYLLHQAVAGIVHGKARGLPPGFADLSEASLTLLALAIVLVLSEISFRFLEAPFLAIGARSRY